ncbi:MAG: hypothetical protein HYZ42_11820, partial [Bacteroidetes bacterium]|nr:hypothetical protein [Bacteroidota bacterium]
AVVFDGGSYSTSTSSFNASYPGLLGTKTDNGAPKAYLNWLIFDRNYVSLTGGFKQITTAGKEAGTDVAHELVTSPTINITNAGYVYIWLSNENTTPVEVYFDDFKVTQTKSPVVATNDYYAFGLTFNSYARENSVPQNFRYTGKEIQDELNLDWIDFGARMYICEIARWGAIDNLAGEYASISPYTYSANNPIMFYDVDGNYFTGATSEVEKVKNFATERRDIAINRIASNLNELVNALNSGDKEAAAGLSETVNGLIKERNGFQETLQEIEGLKNSSQQYNVSVGMKDSGFVSWNKFTHAVDIELNGKVALNAHELKHAYQFEIGATSFSADNNKNSNSFLNDLGDEVEGYKRQALFERYSLPSELNKGITASNISMIKSSNGNLPYSKYPATQQHQLPQFTDKGIAAGAYKNIAKNLNVAFRVNGTTYYP